MSLFGVETRYVLRLYLPRILMVTGAILAVVIAIDLATSFERLIALRTGGAMPDGIAVGRLAHYALLRAAYNLPPILPLAAAIGIVLAERRLAQGWERAAIFDTGRSRLWSLMPALICGLLVGALQQGAVTVLRPLSVTDQSEAGFRSYGSRFAGRVTPVQWLAADRTIVMAQMAVTGEALHLVNLTVFVLDAQNRVARTAAIPAAQIDGDRLRLDPPTPGLPVLRVNADWLWNHGIPPRLLSTDALQAVISGPSPPPDLPAFRAALAARQAAFAEPLALCLLAAALCLLRLRPRSGPLVPVAVVAAVYGCSVAMGSLAILAEFAVLPALPAILGLPALLIAACLGGLAWDEARISRRLRARG